jgi:hypothetical protein
MGTFLVGYDLDKPDQNYPDLINKLKSYETWWHHLDSTWLIKATSTAAKLRDELEAHIGKADKLLVIEVTNVAWATTGLPDTANEWLRSCVAGSKAA